MEFAKSRCKRFETKVIDSGLGPGTYDLKDISRPEGKLGAYCTRSQRFNEVPVLPANLGPGSYSFSPAKEGAALFVGNRKAVGKNRGKKVLEVMNSNKKRKSEPQECQQQMILSPCKDPTKESSLASKVASWETELVTREKQLEEVVGCCGMLSASLMQCKDQQKTYQQECTDLRQSIASLTKEQRTLSLLLDNQKEQTSESRATLRQALQRLEANELCITRMVKMGADLDDILLNNAEELASLLIRNETAKSTEKELRLKVKKLSSMMKTTQSAIESAEKTIQQFAEDVAELEQKLQNQEAAFGEERNQLQQDVINMQSDSERQDKVLDSTLLKVIRLENAQNDFQHKHQLAIARKDAQLRAAAETHSKQMADMKNCHLKIIENMVQEKNIEITALQQAHLKEILNNAALAAETMRIRENELQNVIQNMSLESSVQFDSFDKKVRELVADQAETNEANSNLRENAIKLNSQLKSLQIEQANQEIFVKDMQKDVILKNDKLQELSESLAIKNSRLQQLEQELAAKCHEVVQLKATTEISEEKYRQITEHSSALTQQLTKTLHASESRYSGLFSEHTILRQTLQELTHNLNCLQTQHAAKNLSLEQCESRERAFRKDIMLMEQSRIQLETELQGKYAFVEHKLRELMDEIAQKESVTTTLKTEKITLLEKIAALQKSVSDYQVNLTDLTEKNSSMKESLEMQNKLLNTAQNEYETTFGTVLDLTEQNKILEVKWSASVASCACLEELLQEHKLHSVTVENELAATQLQLQSTIFTLKLIEEKERDIQIQRSTNLEILETRTFERDSCSQNSQNNKRSFQNKQRR